MSTEENSIDDKKNVPDFKGFGISLLSSVFYIILIQVALLGNIGLFLCKVAQSNVLPDNISLEPFGDYVRNVENIEVNINIIKEYGFFGLGWWSNPSKILSQKAIFNEKEVLNSYYHGLVGSLLKYKFSNQYGLYFANVINSVIATNNYFINKIYGFLNSIFSEWLILLFYPILFSFILLFHLVVSFFSTIIYLITNIKELFRIKDNKTREWENDANISYFSLDRLIGWIRLFILLIISGITIIIITLFTFLYGIFSPLFINYKIKGSETKQTFLNFFLNSFLYKSQLFVIILTIILLIKTNEYLGTTYLVGAFIAVIIGIVMGIYKQPIPTNNTFTETTINSVMAKVKRGPLLREKDILNKTEEEGMSGGGKINKEKNK